MLGANIGLTWSPRLWLTWSQGLAIELTAWDREGWVLRERFDGRERKGMMVEGGKEGLMVEERNLQVFILSQLAERGRPILPTSPRFSVPHVY